MKLPEFHLMRLFRRYLVVHHHNSMWFRVINLFQFWPEWNGLDANLMGFLGWTTKFIEIFDFLVCLRINCSNFLGLDLLRWSHNRLFFLIIELLNGWVFIFFDNWLFWRTDLALLNHHSSQKLLIFFRNFYLVVFTCNLFYVLINWVRDFSDLLRSKVSLHILAIFWPKVLHKKWHFRSL